MIKINFIGCGKIGRVIAKLFVERQLGTVSGVVNSTLMSSIEAVTTIGSGTAYTTISELPPADIYFITTPDAEIKQCAQDLINTANLKNGAILVHCSGVFTSDILASANELGCEVVSLHPLKSFAAYELACATFTGTYCTIEGDAPAVKFLKALFAKLGAHMITIKKENKSLYHAASVMANNYLVTLHQQAYESFIAAGIEKAIAKKITTMLMQDAFNNVANSAHIQALTGPIQRGDTQTIVSHLESLAATPKLGVYTSLGLATLSLTDHPESKKSELAEALKSHII